jgi:hypothetical protein
MFIFATDQNVWAHEIIDRIIDFDHSLNQKDIFKFVYYFMILFLIIYICIYNFFYCLYHLVTNGV